MPKAASVYAPPVSGQRPERVRSAAGGAPPLRPSHPAARSPLEEVLSDILETLSRQSEQLEEVLRRLERDNSDTK